MNAKRHILRQGMLRTNVAYGQRMRVSVVAGGRQRTIPTYHAALRHMALNHVRKPAGEG